MALPEVEALDDLEQLDRGLLHVFVVGPGEGEGLAIALPNQGWVLVDGCRSVKRGRPDLYPLEKIVARFASEDAVELMVLTHPHADHVHGLAELIEALAPKRVALTGTSRASIRQSLADEADACEERRKRATAGHARVAAMVLTALRAINTWEETHTDQLIPLHDGACVLEGSVPVRAVSPHQTVVETWFEDGSMPKIMASRANALSAVLELRFGKVMIVLGGDLPVRDGRGRVPTGWDRVLESYPELGHHVSLKVPHHGSRDALHPDLLRRVVGRERVWCLTPFNSSHLPRSDEDDGLDVLLAQQSPVMLTAPSVSKKLQRAHDDGRVTPGALAALTDVLRERDVFQPADTVIRCERALEPLDPVWCVAFSKDGPVRRWRGRAALDVHDAVVA